MTPLTPSLPRLIPRSEKHVRFVFLQGSAVYLVERKFSDEATELL